MKAHGRRGMFGAILESEKRRLSLYVRLTQVLPLPRRIDSLNVWPWDDTGTHLVVDLCRPSVSGRRKRP